MYIVEISHRTTNESLGFLAEAEWRGQTGDVLSQFKHEAVRFNSQRHAISRGQAIVGDNTNLMVNVIEVGE